MQLCDTKNDNIEALKRKKTCKQAVGKCQSAEVTNKLMSSPFLATLLSPCLQAAAVEGIDLCKERRSCGGAKDPCQAKLQMEVQGVMLKLTPHKSKDLYEI